ncbi:MAG: hypothetical protein ACNA7W_20890 [Pseudomonadales bacterium]
MQRIARSDDPVGDGELSLTITGIRELTPRIRAYELRAGDWADLPLADPGAHLEVPARLADGSRVTRQYSLITRAERRNAYEIAVLLEKHGRGGSRAIHETWQVGTSQYESFC